MNRERRKGGRHKLVAIGDSLAQGFKNGGVYRTDLSFPALIARCMGKKTVFDTPSFVGQAGIPINLEVLVRGLSDEFGDKIPRRRYPAVMMHLYRTLRRIKNYWEREENHKGRGRDLPYHNQGVWGFAANDTWLMTEQGCQSHLHQNRPAYSVFSVLPDHAMYITGRLVLNPGFNPQFSHNNQIDNVARLHSDGGVENLIVCAGHNNFVGALSSLSIRYSEPGFLDRPHHERSYTVYRPKHFEEEIRHLYTRISKLGISRVFVPTYPYLTIPPATRGVNFPHRNHNGGYFDYYTRFWIWDEDFNPEKHPHLTRDEAIELDMLADQYNQIICEQAEAFGFHVVPVHKYVHAVARRRQGLLAVRPYPPEFKDALKRHPMTSHLVTPENRVQLTTDFIRVDEETGKLIRGGIFSLDGLHPSTIGYGLIANIYMMYMQKEGVQFERPFDWDWLIEQEELISNPPALLSELRLLLRFLSMGRRERITRFGQNVLQQLLEQFDRDRKTRDAGNLFDKGNR